MIDVETEAGVTRLGAVKKTRRINKKNKTSMKHKWAEILKFIEQWNVPAEIDTKKKVTPGTKRRRHAKD